jgi:hypothetical protein
MEKNINNAVFEDFMKKMNIKLILKIKIEKI